MYKVKRFSKKKNNESKTSKVLAATGAGLTASGLATAGVLNKKSSNLSKEVSKEFTPVDNTQKRVDRMMKDTKDLLDARLTHNNEALLDPRLKSYDEFGKVMEGRFKDFYEPHVGDKIDPSFFKKTDFTEDEIFKLKNELDDNYSRERANAYRHAVKNNKNLKLKAKNIDKEVVAEQLKDFNKNKSNNLRKLKKAKLGRNIGLGVAAAGAGLGAYGVHKMRKEDK